MAVVKTITFFSCAVTRPLLDIGWSPIRCWGLRTPLLRIASKFSQII